MIAAVSGSGPQPGVSLPSSVSEQAWGSDFLSALGAPATAANVASVTDWIAHEGPYGTQGENNPLNTTQAETGSTSFDGLAVQNYPSPTEGLNATVATLENGGLPADPDAAQGRRRAAQRGRGRPPGMERGRLLQCLAA